MWIQVPFSGCSRCRTKQQLLSTSALVHMVQNLLASTRINLLHEFSPYICLSSFSNICPYLLLFLHNQHFVSSIDEPILPSTRSPKLRALACTNTLVSLFRTPLLLSFTCALQWLGNALSTPAHKDTPPIPNILMLEPCTASNKAFKPFLRASMVVNNSFLHPLWTINTAVFFHCSAYKAEYNFNMKRTLINFSPLLTKLLSHVNDLQCWI